MSSCCCTTCRCSRASADTLSSDAFTFSKCRLARSSPRACSISGGRRNWKGKRESSRQAKVLSDTHRAEEEVDFGRARARVAGQVPLLIKTTQARLKFILGFPNNKDHF